MKASELPFKQRKDVRSVLEQLKASASGHRKTSRVILLVQLAWIGWVLGLTLGTVELYRELAAIRAEAKVSR